jgi:hypothetical protein
MATRKKHPKKVVKKTAKKHHKKSAKKVGGALTATELLRVMKTKSVQALIKKTACSTKTRKKAHKKAGKKR